MSLLTPDSPSIDAVSAIKSNQVTGMYAGEVLLAGAPCYIKSSDGQIYMSNGTAANEAAEIVGFTPRVCQIGEPVTLFGLGSRFHYAASGLVPGDRYFIGATAGRLDTAATTGDAVGVAQALSTTDIRVIRES